MIVLIKCSFLPRYSHCYLHIQALRRLAVLQPRNSALCSPAPTFLSLFAVVFLLWQGETVPSMTAPVWAPPCCQRNICPALSAGDKQASEVPQGPNRGPHKGPGRKRLCPNPPCAPSTLSLGGSSPSAPARCLYCAAHLFVQRLLFFLFPIFQSSSLNGEIGFFWMSAFGLVACACFWTSTWDTHIHTPTQQRLTALQLLWGQEGDVLIFPVLGGSPWWRI